MGDGRYPRATSSVWPRVEDSDKAIGVGICNKGVGFKSVFQICDAPEVYSASDFVILGFSGFSFRFGTQGDLNDYVEPDDLLRSKLDSELSLSLLTVPLDATPTTVAMFREQGFVTVLRLPVSTARAASEVRERIPRYTLASRSPIMLFLHRLESTLSFKTSSESPPMLLTRRQALASGTLTGTPPSTRMTPTCSSKASFRRPTSARPSRTPSRRAHSTCAGSSGRAEARVSVAVAEGRRISNPSAFTFLPMGESAKSPLGGHINAPFITDFARLGLDTAQPVNRAPLRSIARVCVEAADTLIAASWKGAAVVDLMAWNPDSLGLITDEVKRLRHLSLEDFIRLPIFGRREWAPLSEISAWRHTSCEVVTIDRLVHTADAQLIDTTQIDADRVNRLADSKAAGESLDPSQARLANWVASVAQGLKNDAASFGEWRSFLQRSADHLSFWCTPVWEAHIAGRV